ncbi:MAG: hypothetical protein ABI554_12380, partial [Flavobacterium sp.]
MRKNLFILLLFVATIGCSSPQKITKNIVPINSEFFKSDAVYSELIDNNLLNLYYFNSEDKNVYISKIKNDTIIYKTNDLKINTTIYGEYNLEGNMIKTQKYTFKNVMYNDRKISERILFFFLNFVFPVHRASSRGAMTVVDKEIITVKKLTNIVLIA